MTTAALPYIQSTLFPMSPAPVVARLQDLDFSKIVQMLNDQSQHLQMPELRFTVDHEDVRIVRLCERMRRPSLRKPGWLYIRWGRLWTTIVDLTGKVIPSGQLHYQLATTPAQLEVLSRLCTSPKSTLADLGRLAGRCCYCGRHLEDRRSTDMGYGPVCAKANSLPWTDAQVAAVIKRISEAMEIDWRPGESLPEDYYAV